MSFLGGSTSRLSPGFMIRVKRPEGRKRFRTGSDGYKQSQIVKEGYLKKIS